MRQMEVSVQLHIPAAVSPGIGGWVDPTSVS